MLRSDRLLSFAFSHNEMRGLKRGATDEQVGWPFGAGENSNSNSDVKLLVRLAADPIASGRVITASSELQSVSPGRARVEQ
jgi:hypothetical protein